MSSTSRATSSSPASSDRQATQSLWLTACKEKRSFGHASTQSLHAAVTRTATRWWWNKVKVP